MRSAATPSSATGKQTDTTRRRDRPLVSRRAGLNLLIGILVVGAIPVVSTARILQANALRSERTRADSALRDELGNGLQELGRLGSNASARAGHLARSQVVQRAMISGDKAALRRLASTRPATSFFLHGKRVAGTPDPQALERSVWLTVDGRRVGMVAVGVALDQRLARRLTLHAPHGVRDRLILARHGRLLGAAGRLQTDGRTVLVHGVRYRAVPAVVPDAKGVRLLALRPDHAITSNVKPYQLRIEYAAIGSFALLALVALLFAGPILRLLGDFRRVASQATTDGLTGLANRRMLDEELALEWRRADRIGDPLAFVLIDLDDFKRVNDDHGHQAGDAVLRAVGGVLTSGVRQADLAGRYGGEEFALILPGTDLAGAQKLAERVRIALVAMRVDGPKGKALTATASFGVAAKGELPSPEKLVADADEALYEAKRAGKNRVVPEPPPELLPDSEPERRVRKPSSKRTTGSTAPKKKAPAKKSPKAAKARKPAPRRPAEGEA
jgi:diguanylate cyclase (GGDEF)-like protein